MNKLLLALGISFSALSMQAEAATFYLDNYLTGKDGGKASAATYNVSQNGSDVSFSLLNTIGNLSSITNADSFISAFDFVSSEDNLDASEIDVSGNSATTVKISKVGTFNNASYKYQVELGFDKSNSANRFVNGESVTWTIKNALESSFTTGNPLAMVHIQGLNGDASTKYGTSSAPTPTPLPAAAWLFGSALVGLTGLSRRKNKTAA